MEVISEKSHELRAILRSSRVIVSWLIGCRAGASVVMVVVASVDSSPEARFVEAVHREDGNRVRDG